MTSAVNNNKVKDREYPLASDLSREQLFFPETPETTASKLEMKDAIDIMIPKPCIVSLDSSSLDTPKILYKRRWLMLFVFCTLTWSSAFLWTTFAPIFDMVKAYWHVSTSQVNMMSMLYLFTYLPGVFVGGWMLDVLGLRWSLVVGAFLNAVGPWIRYVGRNPNGWDWIFAGQFVAACAQSFTLSAPPKIAAEWFGEKERSTATSIGVLANNMGIAFGMLSYNVVKSDSDIPSYLLFCAILCSCVFFLVFTLFRSRPPTPPSNSSDARLTQTSSGFYHFFHEMKLLVLNWGFMLLVLAYGAVVGTYYGITTLIAQVLTRWNAFTVGWIGFSLTASGVAGSIVAGYILDKTGKFKLVNIILYVGTLVFMVLFTLSVEYWGTLSLYLFSIALGFFMTGIMPVAYEFAGEISYPVSENVSSGVLNFSANLIAIFPIYLLANSSTLTINLVFTIMVSVGLVSVICVREKLTRYAMDHKNMEPPSDLPFKG